MPLKELKAFSKIISNLADKPNMSAADLKAYWDSSPEELRVALNGVIAALKNIENGDSGADNIGATAITPQSGETVQSILKYLKTQIDNVVLNVVPDSSITKAKLSADAQALIENSYKMSKSSKDNNGIFTTVEYRRQDNTLAIKSVFSGTSPNYTTRTLTFYKEDGVTIEKTMVRTLVYNSDGVLISEV